MTIERSLLTGAGAGSRAMGSVAPRSEPVAVLRPGRAPTAKVSPRWGCALVPAVAGLGALRNQDLPASD